jgi:hypothetical protein
MHDWQAAADSAQRSAQTSAHGVGVTIIDDNRQEFDIMYFVGASVWQQQIIPATFWCVVQGLDADGERQTRAESDGGERMRLRHFLPEEREVSKVATTSWLGD